MFKDTSRGTAHYYGDGCIPPHKNPECDCKNLTASGGHQPDCGLFKKSVNFQLTATDKLFGKSKEYRNGYLNGYLDGISEISLRMSKKGKRKNGKISKK